MTSPAAPTPKVAAAGLAGAAAVVLVWIAGLAGVEVPAEVAGSIVALIAGGAGYLTPDPARRE